MERLLNSIAFTSCLWVLVYTSSTPSKSVQQPSSPSMQDVAVQAVQGQKAIAVVPNSKN